MCPPLTLSTHDSPLNYLSFEETKEVQKTSKSAKASAEKAEERLKAFSLPSSSSSFAQPHYSALSLCCQEKQLGSQSPTLPPQEGWGFSVGSLGSLMLIVAESAGLEEVSQP